MAGTERSGTETQGRQGHSHRSDLTHHRVRFPRGRTNDLNNASNMVAGRLLAKAVLASFLIRGGAMWCSWPGVVKTSSWHTSGGLRLGAETERRASQQSNRCWQLSSIRHDILCPYMSEIDLFWGFRPSRLFRLAMHDADAWPTNRCVVR